MAEKGEVFKCDACGNMVAITQGVDDDSICCGEDIQLVSESEANDFLAGLSKI